MSQIVDCYAVVVKNTESGSFNLRILTGAVMPKLPNTLTMIVLLLVTPAVFADEDDLFSDVKTKSVFEDASTKPDAASSTGIRVTSPEELRDLLKGAGFETKVASSQAVTLEKKLDPWTFPILMVISDDEKRISIMLGLSTVKDVTKELPATTLLAMMTASQENAPLLFSYHAKRERTELSQVIDNKNVTGLTLRDAVNQMALTAKGASDVWSSNEAASPKTEPTTPDTPKNPNSSTLTGKWSAAKSATEAFAVELSATGTFNLVYINNGKQVKSSGQFTTDNGLLSLVGADGVKLEGKLTIKSAQEFTFEPNNSTPMVFTRAK